MPPSIETLDQWRAGFERLMDERFAAHSKALDLQAREYERRLEALNGEASRISKSQADHVQRPVYDIEVGALNRRMQVLENWKSNMEGKLWGIGLLVTVVNLALHYYFKQ
jgi:hypothetical protein